MITLDLEKNYPIRYKRIYTHQHLLEKGENDVLKAPYTNTYYPPVMKSLATDLKWNSQNNWFLKNLVLDTNPLIITINDR